MVPLSKEQLLYLLKDHPFDLLEPCKPVKSNLDSRIVLLDILLIRGLKTLLLLRHDEAWHVIHGSLPIRLIVDKIHNCLLSEEWFLLDRAFPTLGKKTQSLLARRGFAYQGEGLSFLSLLYLLIDILDVLGWLLVIRVFWDHLYVLCHYWIGLGF